MMFVKAELLGLVETVAESIDLPPVDWVYIPEPDPGPGRHTEFGIVTLRDGSAGLYYAWLGASQKGMGSRYEPEQFNGRHPVELARYCAGDDEADCSLGLAAINAITRHVFRTAGFTPMDAPDSMGILDITAADHVGMVGYFPSLVKRLRNNGIRLTVIEKKPQFHKQQENFLVSADPQTLEGCTKVMITASTLLNNSIDEVLEYSRTRILPQSAKESNDRPDRRLLSGSPVCTRHLRHRRLGDPLPRSGATAVKRKPGPGRERPEIPPVRAGLPRPGPDDTGIMTTSGRNRYPHSCVSRNLWRFHFRT